MDAQTRVANHVDGFCWEHGISRSHFYNLLKRGKGPAIMKVGRRTLISADAAAEWRQRMERASSYLCRKGQPVMMRFMAVPAGPSEMLPLCLTEELEGLASRVRSRLGSMTANIIEIGRELRAVKGRLEYGQFLWWVEEACKLSPRTAQLMMKAAEWAEGRDEIVSHLEPTAIYLLAARSTPEAVREQVLSQLEKGQRPAPHVVKDMIRAAREKKPATNEKLGLTANPQLQAAQPDETQAEAAEQGLDPYSDYAALGSGAAEDDGAHMNGEETEAEPPQCDGHRQRKESLQDPFPQGLLLILPDIDPLQERDPPWINGALRLIPLLAGALPLEDGFPNRSALIHGALQLIPALTEAALELREIPNQQLIGALLKYCGYNDYAARISGHVASAATPRTSDNDFEAIVARFRDTTATAITGGAPTEPGLREAADVA